MPMKIIQVRRWEIVMPFVLLTLVCVLGLVWVQYGRLESCRRTYEGVRQVFRPFFPPPGGPSSIQQQKNIVKFDNRVDMLKAHCGSQVKLWWP